MIEKLKQLGKDSIIYGLGGVLARTIGFFVLPILTRIFTPADYGTIELLTTVSGFVHVFMSLGMDSAQTYYFYESRDNEHKKKVIRTTLGFYISWGIIIFLICFGLIPVFNQILFDGESPEIYFIMVLVTAFFTNLQSNFTNLFRLLFKPWNYLTTSLTNTILGYGLAILLVVYLQKHISGYLFGHIISAVTVMLVSVFLLAVYLDGKFSWNLLKDMLKYGTPLFPTSFALWLIRLSDRYFLAQYLDLKDVGIYAVGAKFALIIALGTQAFRLSWMPLSMSISKEPDANKFYLILGKGYLVLGSIGVIILTGISMPLMMLLTIPEYYSGFKVVGLLSYGAIFYGFYTISGLGVWLGKKTIYVTVAIMVSAIMNLAFNATLIPIMGIIGAGLASCLAHVVGNLLTLYFSEKHYPIGFSMISVIGIILLTLLIIFTQIFILDSDIIPVVKYSIIAIICVISTISLIYFGIGKDNLIKLFRLLKATIENRNNRV